MTKELITAWFVNINNKKQKIQLSAGREADKVIIFYALKAHLKIMDMTSEHL